MCVCRLYGCIVCLCVGVQESSDVQAAVVDEKAEQYRAALDKAMVAYTKEHYPSGVVTVSPPAVHIYTLAHSLTPVQSGWLLMWSLINGEPVP